MLNQSMSAKEYNERGRAYAREGNLEQAITDFTKAIRLKPNSAKAYSNRGLAYANKGNPEEAITDYNQAIKRNPNFAEAYYNRGNIYLNQGDFERAIRDFNKAIELASKLDPPDLVGAYNNRGLAYEQQGDFEQAITDYNQAIERNPNLAEAYSNRGVAYARKRNLEQAITDYNQAIERNPELVKVYWIVHDKAIADFTKAIEFNREYAPAYNNRGLAYANKGNLEQAITDYNQAIERNPEYAPAYNNRGLAYYRLGVNRDKKLDVRDDRNYFQEAMDDYDQAIELASELDPSELDPSELANFHFDRSCIWLRWKEWKKAKADLTAAQDRGLNIALDFFKRHGNNSKDVTDAYADFPPCINRMLRDPLNEKVSITMNALTTNVTAGGSSYIEKVVSLRATVEFDAANYSDETISLLTNNDKVVFFVTNSAASPSILVEYKEGTIYDLTICITEITLHDDTYYVYASIILD